MKTIDVTESDEQLLAACADLILRTQGLAGLAQAQRLQELVATAKPVEGQ